MRRRLSTYCTVTVLVTELPPITDLFADLDLVVAGLVVTGLVTDLIIIDLGAELV